MRDGSQVFIIATNRFRIMARNRLFILLCIVLPLLFSVMVNRIFAKSSLYDSVPIAVIDLDNSVLSQRVMGDIKKNPTIDMQVIAEGEIEEYISKEKVQAVYVFEQGMEASIKAGEYDEIISVYIVPGSLTAMGISDIIAGEIIPAICEYKVINTAQKLLPEEEKGRIVEGISSRIEALQLDKNFEMPVIVDMRTPLTDKSAAIEEDKNVFSTSIGLGLIIIFSTLFMLTGSSIIIKERESKVRSRIKTAGVTPLKLLAADLLSLTSAGILIILLQFIMMYTVFKKVSVQGLIIAFLVMIVYALTAASMLILFSAIFKKHISFQSFMPIVILLMGILSGCIWSLEMMPTAIGRFALFMPSYWAHSGLSEIILYQGSIQTIMMNLVMLFTIAATLSTPAYMIYRKQVCD